MRTTIIARYIGLVLLLAGAGMALSSLVDLFSGGDAALVLLVSALLVASFGAFPPVFVPRAKSLSRRESLAIVAGGWVAISLAGALPYLLWGPPFSVANALFESFSGFTTTGSSILEQIEVLPAGLLFWRSLTHWIGGVGIIVLALAIIPRLGPLSHALLRHDLSNVAVKASAPRAVEVARVILVVYVGLTLLETGALMVAGLSLFDASTHAFATIATGGFSPRDGSVAAFGSVSVEMIILVFMILSGVNFALLFGLVFTPRQEHPGRSTAFAYLGMLAAATAIVTLNVHGAEYSWGQALRYASFQVCSVGTSTGFASADSAVWPAGSQAILMLLALVGASAGSTAGAIKVDRMVLLTKLLRFRFRKLSYPDRVALLRVEGRAVDISFAYDAMLFVAAYLMIVALASILVALTGVPLLESVSGTIACMGNIGPGLGQVGSMGHFNGVPDTAKLLLAGVMVVGRVEIYGILMLFTKRFWTD